jgi:hypothetical protein
MNVAGVVIWWILVVFVVVGFVACVRLLSGGAVVLWLTIIIIMVILGVAFFTTWDNSNANTIQGGETVWYISSQTRSTALDDSIIEARQTNANTNSFIGTATMNVLSGPVESNQIVFTPSTTAFYILMVKNNSNIPINLTVTSTTLTFSGPLRTAP